MTPLLPLNNHFDLENIFPSCIKEYNDLKIDTTNLFKNKFYNICSIFINNINPSNKNYSFHSACSYLISYLNHIDVKYNEERVPHCKYFYFKLKDEINYLKPTCKDEIDCYQKMISIMDPSTQNYIVPRICKDTIQKLNEDTFSLFQKLEALYYKNISDLLQENEECLQTNHCFTNYKELCKICQNSNNEGLRSVLNKFKDEHLQNVFDAPSCIKPHKNILSYSIRTVLLTSFIITFSIPFVTFILYEYTPCGLYMQTSIRKLKEIWNIKRKEEKQLINSFENTYDELVDKWSQISYSAIDCN